MLAPCLVKNRYWCETAASLKKSVSLTKKNKKITVNLAINYGAKNEIIRAIKKIKKKITIKNLEKNLYLGNNPNPDILIRTGGHQRLSNFMLWQLAYTELFFLDKLWPDFNFNDLRIVIKKFKNNNIRISIFINPSIKTLSNLENIKPDRVELYTYDYAKNYQNDKILAVAPYNEVTKYLEKEFPNIELNAGHDLNLDNLDFILKNIPRIKEVSIGHALVCDAFDFGLKETVNKYKQITQR